jgi:hypothetical protein
MPEIQLAARDATRAESGKFIPHAKIFQALPAAWGNEFTAHFVPRVLRPVNQPDRRSLKARRDCGGGARGSTPSDNNLMHTDALPVANSKCRG